MKNVRINILLFGKGISIPSCRIQMLLKSHEQDKKQLCHRPSELDCSFFTLSLHHTARHAQKIREVKSYLWLIDSNHPKQGGFESHNDNGAQSNHQLWSGQNEAVHEYLQLASELSQWKNISHVSRHHCLFLVPQNLRWRNRRFWIFGGWILFSINGVRFSSNTSASSWEALRRAIQIMITVYSQWTNLVEKHKDLINFLEWDDSPSTKLVQTVKCKLNQGVPDENGEIKPLTANI